MQICSSLQRNRVSLLKTVSGRKKARQSEEMLKSLIAALLVCAVDNVLAEQLVITPEGRTHVAAIDSNSVFTCQVTNAQVTNAYLKWFDTLDQEIIESSGRIYVENIDDVTKKLYITNIEEIDSGQYTCEGLVQGNTERQSIQLQIYKDITFDVAPSPQNPVEFEDSLIQCEVSGSPAPVVSWRYRGQTVETGGRYVVDPTYGLRIQNITEQDNGFYECRAEVPLTGNILNFITFHMGNLI